MFHNIKILQKLNLCLDLHWSSTATWTHGGEACKSFIITKESQRASNSKCSWKIPAIKWHALQQIWGSNPDLVANCNSSRAGIALCAWRLCPQHPGSFAKTAMGWDRHCSTKLHVPFSTPLAFFLFRGAGKKGELNDRWSIGVLQLLTNRITLRALRGSLGLSQTAQLSTGNLLPIHPLKNPAAASSSRCLSSGSGR